MHQHCQIGHYRIKGTAIVFYYHPNNVEGGVQAAEECSAVLELDAKHTGALMLRAQTLVAMKDYHSALFDVNRLLDLNPSSEVYRNLQARLRTQLVNGLLFLLVSFTEAGFDCNL